MSTKELPEPGQYTLTSLDIHRVSGGVSDHIGLLDIFNTVSISSSIHKKALTLSINITDMFGIFQLYDLSGDELISLSFKSPQYFGELEGPERQLFFRITNITQLTGNDVTNSINFQIDAVHEIAYYQSFTSLDGYFEGTIKDLVKLAFEEAKGACIKVGEKLAKTDVDLIAGDTTGIAKCIIPSETPFDAIDYFLAWAEHEDDFLFFFYQTLNGFVFTNVYNFEYNMYIDNPLLIEGMGSLQLRKSHRFYHDPRGVYKGRTSPLSKMQRALSVNQISRNGTFGLADRGALHNSVVNVDYFYKNTNTISKKFTDLYDDVKGSARLFNGELLKTTEKFIDNFSKESNSTDYHYQSGATLDDSPMLNGAKSIADKKIIGLALFNNLIQLKVYGRSELDVGHIINLNFREINQFNDEVQYDPELTGNFLVKDLIHTFTRNGYHQVLNVCRIGTNEDNNEVDGANLPSSDDPVNMTDQGLVITVTKGRND